MCCKQVGSSGGAPALQGDDAVSPGAGVGGLLCRARSSGEKGKERACESRSSGAVENISRQPVSAGKWRWEDDKWAP
jgi:hypothetical protein